MVPVLRCQRTGLQQKKCRFVRLKTRTVLSSTSYMQAHIPDRLQHNINGIFTVYLATTPIRDEPIVLVVKLFFCTPLCSDYTSDKPSNSWICHSNCSHWIFFNISPVKQHVFTNVALFLDGAVVGLNEALL